MANYTFRSKLDEPQFDITIEGQTLTFRFDYSDEHDFKVDNEHNKCIYKNIYRGVDVVYYLSADMLKEYILIWGSQNIPSEISFTVTSNDNIVFYITPDGEMQFRSFGGQHLISLNKMTLTDSNGENIGDVHISHRAIGDEHHFSIGFNEDYAEQQIAYPLVLDPPITFGSDNTPRVYSDAPRVFSSQSPYGGRVTGDNKFAIRIYQDDGPYPVHTWKGTPIAGTVPLYPALTFNDSAKQLALIYGYGMESWTITIEFICNKILGIPGSAPRIYYSVDYVSDIGVHSHNNETTFVGNISGSSVYRGHFTVHKNSFPSYLDGTHLINIKHVRNVTYALPFEITVYAPERAAWSFKLLVGGPTDFVMVDPSFTNRNIANDSGETEYYLNSWNLGVQHAATNSNTIQTTKSTWTFDTGATTLRARIYGGATTSTILAQNSQTIAGNTDNTTDGIRIQVTNWTIVGANFTGDITITFDLVAIAAGSANFTNGGRFYIEITHFNGDMGEYTYSSRSAMSDDMFYDNSSDTQTISGLAVGPQMDGVTGKWLSGVLYFALGDQMNVAITDMDYLNANTYPDDIVSMDTSEYGIDDHYLQSDDLTGWTNAFDNTNASYSFQDEAIDRTSYRLMGQANVGAQVVDWTSGAIDTTNDTVCIDTYTTTSNGQSESFNQETWRCIVGAQFDYQDAKNYPYGFQGNQTLGVQDAQFTDGKCLYPFTDYSNYEPGDTMGAGDPDYSSGFQSTAFLYREFQHPLGAQSSTSGTLTLTLAYGSENLAALKLKLGKAYDGTATGGTQWVNMLTQYDVANWNNGIGNQGCANGAPIGAQGGSYDWTIGTNNISNITDGTVYIMVGLQAGTQVSALSMSFD